MNCILSNDNAFVYDAMMGGMAGPMTYDSDAFVTPYGLVYPMHRGWEVLRMLQDVDQPEDLLKESYLRRYLPVANHRLVYLDWNARLWLLQVSARWTADKDTASGTAFVVNRIAQTARTVFVGREHISPDVLAALNLAMRDCNSYKEAFRLLEKTTTERFAEPVFLSLAQHRASKPAGAINMPNPISSPEGVSSASTEKVC